MRNPWFVAAVGLGLVLVACGSAETTTSRGAGGTATTTMEDMPGMADMPGMDHSGQAGQSGQAANAGCTPSGTTVAVVAENTKFTTDCLAAPADQSFTINYDNKDAGITHNLVIVESHRATDVMFRAEGFKGAATMTFTAGPFKPGTYAYHCEFHPNVMKGTFVVK